MLLLLVVARADKEAEVDHQTQLNSFVGLFVC